MPQRPSNFFTTIAGVPVHYNRDTASDYPTRGRPARFYGIPELERKLDSCLQELWSLNPYGKAEVITSAGAFVDKPTYHGLGRAFDLDGIFWSRKSFITLYDGYRGGDRKFYFGVEAVLRKHFGIVLDYNYNADHRDHFHVDDGELVGFRTGATSLVKFLQAALVNVFGLSVGSSGVDGDYGNNTRSAVGQALSRLGISGDISNQAVWLQFLTGTARTAFGSGTVTPREFAIVNSPLELGGGQPIEVEITAQSGIASVMAIASDGTPIISREEQGNLLIRLQPAFFGEKTILIKGFDAENRQVAETTVIIAAERSAPNPYQPPEGALPLLGEIVPTLEQATQIQQPFVDCKIFLELEGGELYIDTALPPCFDGSPRAEQFDPCRGYRITSLSDQELSGQEQYLNAEEIPYIALPPGYEIFGVALGDIVAVIVDERIEFAVFANVSRGHKLLSGSLALLRSVSGNYFDGDITPRGISENAICLIFPGSGDGTPRSPEAVRQIGRNLWERLGGRGQAPQPLAEVSPQNTLSLLSFPITTVADEIDQAFSQNILEEIAQAQKDPSIPAENASLFFEAAASDVDVVARTIFGEARGESDQGKLAVAYTIINRVKFARDRGGSYWWGNTLREVCWKPFQYSCWNNRDVNRPIILRVTRENRVFANCLTIAQRAIDQLVPDPASGATHYYATFINAPAWVRGATFIVQIGTHRFYKNVR